MATFEEFRASFPKSTNQKGKRFEYFLCHWFLKQHPLPKNKFKKIWHYKDWPKKWSNKDLGTDLIAQDENDKIWAIQAKCYAEKNTVTKGEVDSFLADSAKPGIDYRLLIATTDRIGLNASVTIEGQEKPVQLFLLQDFLDAEMDWPATRLQVIAKSLFNQRRRNLQATPLWFGF